MPSSYNQAKRKKKGKQVMRKYGVVEEKAEAIRHKSIMCKSRQADTSPSGKAASPGAHSVRNRPALAAEARRQRKSRQSPRRITCIQVGRLVCAAAWVRNSPLGRMEKKIAVCLYSRRQGARCKDSSFPVFACLMIECTLWWCGWAKLVLCSHISRIALETRR